MFLCISASSADAAAAVDLNRIKTILANDLITFFIDGIKTDLNQNYQSCLMIILKLLQFHFLSLILIY